MYESMMKVITGYGLISGFAVIGLTMWVSYWISDTFTKGRLRTSGKSLDLANRPQKLLKLLALLGPRATSLHVS